MASVYYLYDDTLAIIDEIVTTTRARSETSKIRYFAALLIQKVYRGYAVRRRIKLMGISAIIIQKYYRGFITRWHMPEIAEDAFRRKCLCFYNKMASIIQANWKGYATRKVICIKDLIRERNRLAGVNERLAQFLRDLFAKQKIASDTSLDAIFDGVSLDELLGWELDERRQRRYIPVIVRNLFERHHLLRTLEIEGVLSIHDARELSDLENFLKLIQHKDYMKDLKKIYYDNPPNPPPYIFKDKNLRRLEDLNRLKRIRDAAWNKTNINKEVDKEVQKNMFIRKPILDDEPYERFMLSGEKYTGRQNHVFRDTEDTRHNISNHDFDLTVYQKTEKPHPHPPYHIDYWTKKCCVHNLPE